MTEPRSISISKPFEIFGKHITTVKLKEPTGGQYVKFGDPRILVFNASGSGYWVEQPETIKAYLETLLEPNDLGSDLLNHLSLDDVMAIKEELFAFFTRAAERRRGISSTA